MKMNKPLIFPGFLMLVLTLFFASCKDPVDNETVTVIAVTGITGLPDSAVAGIPLTLTGTVTPDNATNTTIVWSVLNAGDTGATITGGNVLNTTAAGTVTVTATIAGGLTAGTPYTQDFSVTVAPFVPVADIIDLPDTAEAGTPLVLTGTVKPDNANFKTIAWNIKNTGDTGAIITGGNSFSAAAAGTVTVTATVADGLAVGTPYTKDFPVTVRQAENFSITFTQIADEAPSITGPTLSLSNTGWPVTRVLEADNPGQYTGIIWYITGNAVGGIGPSFTLDAANTAYNRVGKHFLTVEVIKDGIQYNRTVTFTITE